MHLGDVTKPVIPDALEGASMRGRQVILRRGRHVGWWVEGRWASGHLFMKTWWPTQGLARMVARFVGGRANPAGGAEAGTRHGP
jgi:hypothetical protein